MANEIQESQVQPVSNGAVIIFWLIGFLISLAFLWVIVRVVSGAWHINCK